MLAVFLHTLKESFHRRMGLVLFVFSLFMSGFYLWMVRVVTQPDGTVAVYRGGRLLGPAAIYVPSALSDLLSFSGGPFLLLGIFAVAPLLTSYMEKGWVDLVLSKGVTRWQVLLGRYAGALGIFIVSYLIIDVVPAVYFWIRAGVEPGRFFGALSLLVFSFAALAALMALASVAVPNPAVPIMLAFLQLTLSGLLRFRERTLYDVITAKWAQWLIDWLYRILPKNDELRTAAVTYLTTGNLARADASDAWWPVWSTALFLLGTLALAWYTFHRKSY